MNRVPIAILIGCALTILIILVAAIADSGDVSGSHFKIRTVNGFFSIQNVGFSQVRILEVDINDRPECRPGGMKFPIDMKLGDSDTWWTICGIVSATIKTNQGTETYTFN